MLSCAPCRYVSHEIRTPMNILSMGIDLIENDLKAGKILATTVMTVEEMKGTTRAVLRILNDLLLYEKMHSQEMVLEITLVSPIVFLYSIARPFQLHARQAGLDLRILNESSNDLEELRDIRISIDSNKLGQAVSNFISNVLFFCFLWVIKVYVGIKIYSTWFCCDRLHSSFKISASHEFPFAAHIICGIA